MVHVHVQIRPKHRLLRFPAVLDGHFEGDPLCCFPTITVLVSYIGIEVNHISFFSCQRRRTFHVADVSEQVGHTLISSKERVKVNLMLVFRGSELL